MTESLDPAIHVVTDFASGESALDEWLRLYASGAQARRLARTFVWIPGDDAVVGGYFSLAAHVVTRDLLPPAVGHGGPEQIPSVLIARLAVDGPLQNSGNGGLLLADALSRIVRATEVVAARLVVVDALNEDAAGLYERFGFRRIPGSLRLAQKVSTVSRAVELL